MIRLRISSVLLGCAVLLVCLVGAAMAPTNPILGTVTVWYYYDDGDPETENDYSYVVAFWGASWVPTYTNWCQENCRTNPPSGEKQKFRHGHFGVGIPFNDGYHHSPALEVTADMVNDYYDPYYEGYTRQSEPTCETNCHSYACERSVCVSGQSDGMAYILEDEYTNPPAGQPFTGSGLYSDPTGHSARATFYDCTAPDPELVGKVRVRSEKTNASGVYRKDFYPEAGDEGPGDLYVKK